MILILILFSSLSAQTITVDTGTVYQTMKGWEGVEQACHDECTQYATFRDSLMDAIVEMGINRVRLEILTNSTCSAATWNYTDLDSKITKVVNPLRTRMTAQGESLWVNLCMVDNQHCYGAGGGAGRPLSEYADRFRKTVQYIQTTYGWTPDSFEIALEPGFISQYWLTSDVNSAIPLLRTELIGIGISNPYLIAPSTPGGSGTFSTYFDALSVTNRGYLSELSYHRYDTVTAGDITSRATAAGKPPAMLEYGNANYNHLYTDVGTIGVVAWEKFALAFVPSPGYEQYQYFDVTSLGGTTFTMNNDSKYLRQYFKHVRLNAQRVSATSGNGNFEPLAFRNANGKVVVVVKAGVGGSFTIGGLPANTYGIFYTTANAYNQSVANQTISGGQQISTSIPEGGVITVYALNADSGVNPKMSVTGRVGVNGRVN